MTATNTRRDKATAIHAALRDEIARHRANLNLSDDGKQRMIAAAHTEAQSKLNALKLAETAERAATRSRLERDLFGTPAGTSATDYRDAQARADLIESPEQARSWLTRAIRNADQGLARAILARGFEAGWTDVVDHYVDARPNDVPAIDALIALNVEESPAARRHSRLDTDALFGAGIPAELRNTSESSRAALAAEADQVVETTPTPFEDPSQQGISAHIGGDHRLVDSYGRPA